MFGLLKRLAKIVVTALALTAAIAHVPTAEAHGYVSNPPSRNYLASRVGAEYDVQSLNGNGPWGTWPSGVWAPGGGGNHPVCGRDVYAARGPPQATWNSGQIVDLSVTVTAVHAGHFYFGLCPSGQLSPQCAYSHLLTNAATGKPYYDMAWTGGQRYGFTGVHNMRFKLPQGFSCDPCVLYWHWVTGNSCDPPGASPSGMLPCGTPGSVPEEFWNCVDVRVIGVPAPNPTPKSPVQTRKFPRGDILRCPGSNDRWISTGVALRKFDATGLNEFTRLRPASNGASRQVSCAEIGECKVGDPATKENMKSTMTFWDAAHPQKPTRKPVKTFPSGDILRCPGSNDRWISTGVALRKFDASGLREFIRQRPSSNGASRQVSCADIWACKVGDPATTENMKSTVIYWDAAHPSSKPAPKPASKPIQKPVVKSIPKPIQKPAVKPTPKPIATPSPKPIQKPIVTPAPKPASKPIQKPVVKSIPKPVATPSPKPIQKPAGKPTPKPIATPSPKPIPKP